MRRTDEAADRDVVHPLHFRTLGQTLVGTSVLLALAPGLPLVTGLVGLALALAGLGKAAEPGRLQIWKGRWEPKLGFFDGFILFACAILPVMVSGAVIWTWLFG